MSHTSFHLLPTATSWLQVGESCNVSTKGQAGSGNHCNLDIDTPLLHRPCSLSPFSESHFPSGRGRRKIASPSECQDS